MYKFDKGDAWCTACNKYVVKPCFFILETNECRRLQAAIEAAKLRSKSDDEFPDQMLKQATDMMRNMYDNTSKQEDNSGSYDPPSYSGGGGDFGGGGASGEY